MLGLLGHGEETLQTEEGRRSRGLCLSKPVPYTCFFLWDDPSLSPPMIALPREGIQGCFVVMGSLSVPRFPYPKPLSWFCTGAVGTWGWLVPQMRGDLK